MNENFNDLYAVLVSLVVTLNGIGLPVSYAIIAENFKQYLDDSIYERFSKREEFFRNALMSIGCLIIFMVPLIINFNLQSLADTRLIPIYQSIRGVYFIITMFALAGFLIAFFQFLNLLYRFATNSQEIIFDMIKKDVDEFLQ